MLTKLHYLQLGQLLFTLKTFAHINKQVIFATEF